MPAVGDIDTDKLNKTRDAWVALAKKYKNSTFVCFNLFNAPTWSQSEANYISIHVYNAWAEARGRTRTTRSSFHR